MAEVTIPSMLIHFFLGGSAIYFITVGLVFIGLVFFTVLLVLDFYEFSTEPVEEC